jgi:hypothetical protein
MADHTVINTTTMGCQSGQLPRTRGRDTDPISRGGLASKKGFLDLRE